MVGTAAHYENFPVASPLLPAGMRRHVAALYAFARAADDFADEGDHSREQRLQLLGGWQQRLRVAATSDVPGPPPRDGEPADTVALFSALGASIRDRGLPVTLFEDLLSAFRQDVTTTRYATWNELLDYCRRSANPVGRLVLRIAGRDTPERDRWSDDICTALQLTNFWQDLAIDFQRGRIYLPVEEMRAHHAREAELAKGTMSPAWQNALAAASARTCAMFDSGRPVCDAVGGRLRYELRATWLGGTKILERLERAGFDVARHRPTIGPRDAPWFAWKILTWTSGSRRPEGLRDA